jgi:hypothetical protein
MVFDLLYRDGRDLTARPLRDRRVRLEDIVGGRELVFAVRRLAPDGFEAWKQVIERGCEGYVAKDETSAYEGGATRRCLKVKQKGWTIGDKRWTRRISVAARRHADPAYHRDVNCLVRGVGDIGSAVAYALFELASESFFTMALRRPRHVGGWRSRTPFSMGVRNSKASKRCGSTT